MMTDLNRPNLQGTSTGTGAFDAALGTELRAGLEDTADLSSAVLTRLAIDSRPPMGGWLAPAPLAASFAGLMTAAGVAGYVWLPLFGTMTEDAILAAALGGLVPGGF